MTAPTKDWPSFWSSLTPQEVRDAIDAAPKVAMAWEHIGAHWYRTDRELIGLCRDDDEACTVNAASDGTGYWYVDHAHHGTAPSLDAAKQAADAALTAAGWVLL